MSRKTRNTVKCTRYKTEKRREKNKLRKLLKRQKTHPRDGVMNKCIDRLKEFLGV